MILRLWLVYTIFLFVKKCCTELVITECQKGRSAVGEGTTVTLTCGKYDVDMEWTNGDHPGTVIGQCNRASCTTNNSLPSSLQAHETGSKQYESVLSITNISSEQTFHVKCRSEDLDETAKCLLYVLKPPQYDPTTCKVWLSNWRVLGECTVERMAVSGIDYECYWSVNNEGKFGGFKDAPSYYTLHSVNYTRRVCSFNRKMNFTEKTFTYSMIVTGIKDHFTQTITVEDPGEATHTCPTMVGEGSSVTCRCNSSRAGNPPATTVWDGVKNEILHIENIQRQTQTNVYTCRVVWGSDGWINRSTLHTFDVAYGPSSVRIDNIDETGNEREKRRLMCTAVDVHPSAIFTWNITCDNQTHNSNTSTCTFSTANVSQETVVTCTAINNFSSDMSSYSSFVFDRTVTFSGEKSSEPKKYLPVVLPAVLPVLILIVIIAVIKCWRKVLMSKRRESSTPDFLPETEELAPESPTTSTFHYVNTIAMKEETEKGAKCNNDTLQSKISTDYDEVCDRLPPERCAAPSGDVYTRASKGSHHLNRETSDHNNPTIEEVIEGGASNFTQDEIDMSGQYYHKIKFVKKSEPKRDIGDSGDIHRKADKDKKREDAKLSQDVPLLIRLESSESDSQSTVDGCVSPSRGIYANVAETCKWQDDDNDDDSPHSLWPEATDVDINVPVGTWVKSGERASDSSSYLHPIPPDDDTYNRLML